MLDALTPPETDRLYWRLVRAMAAVADEIDSLGLAPAAVRDMLYGERCLEQYRALAAELADLADNDVPITAKSWAAMLADTPEEGSPQWQDSDARKSSAQMTFTRLANRVALARAWRRQTIRR